jgi:hypothetical protein
MDQRYVELVRFAYLAADDGRRSADRLLAVAHRAVRQVATGGAPGRAAGQDAGDFGRSAMWDRLAARLLRPRPRLWPYPRLIRWLHSTPWQLDGGDTPTRDALRRLPPHERVAYLLCRLEGQTASEVYVVAGGSMLAGPGDAERALDAVAAATGLEARGQRAELTGFDPSVVRLDPVPPRPRRRSLTAAGMVTVLAAVLAAGYGPWWRAGGADVPAVIGADAWRRAAVPGLAVWPTRGDRRGDRPLLRRALHAWLREGGDRPLGRVAVLFAGTLDDAAVVVLRDDPGTRAAPTVAKYAERPLSRGIESIRPMAPGAGQLVLLDGGSRRYLLPPWRGELRYARLAEQRPRWRLVPVRDGVSDPLPWEAFDADCQFYAALRLIDRSRGRPETVTQLASHGERHLTPEVAFRPQRPPASPDLPSATPGAGSGVDRGWPAVRALSCSGPLPLPESGDLRLRELWRGRLPDYGGMAALFTVDRSDSEQSGTALLVSLDGRFLAEGVTTSAYTDNDDQAVAGAAWWRSARTGRWHLVVAADAMATVEAVGKLGDHTMDGDALIVRGPKGDGAAEVDGELPVVQVVTHDRSGVRATLTP